MDRIAIPDRLESATPIREVGPHNASNGDSERRRRQRALPPAETSEESADSPDPEKPHQIDELA